MASVALIIGVFLSFTCQRAAAHGGNGMDMSMDDGMMLGQGNMLPFLHFVPGDTLWFLGWVPRSARSMVGTCIGLFLLGLVERWIGVSRAIIEVHWDKRAQIALSNKRNEARTDAGVIHRLPPFIPAHDISRGVVQVVQSSIDFALMLAVMTFQVSFILSIVVGLGVGEMLFGRFADAAAHLA